MSTVPAPTQSAGTSHTLRLVGAGELPSVEALRRHFLKKYPILKSGALPGKPGTNSLVTQARMTLRRGPVLPGALPILVLRETLEAIGAASSHPSTRKAGLTAINPKSARLWWDSHLLDNLDDILARLEKPRPVLRFYDVTGLDPEGGRWNSTFDLDVDFGDRGRTVQFWASDRTYVVDLGYVHADGRFLQLARTNSIDLPRDGRGPAGDGELVRSLLRKRTRTEWDTQADETAREWVLARPDDEHRDVEAEILVHMLYRSFLANGPRVLRRAPILERRDRETLRREYSARDRERVRHQALPAALKEAKRAPFLVLPLREPIRLQPGQPVRHQVLPSHAVQNAWTRRLGRDGGKVMFAWYRSLLASIRTARARTLFADLAQEQHTPVELPMPAASSRPDMIPATASLTRTEELSLLASPVFEAAKHLRESLSTMPALDTVDSRDILRVIRDGDLSRREAVPERHFGGIEAKRFAKAGVRITRMALTLEGRMRPGARLKVAGKLVHADADGRFRLECVLSGKKAAIPLRAGTSIGGEARSLISVEWEKRLSHEVKKV